MHTLPLKDCSRPPFKACLFDLDGTLLDTAPDFKAALDHCLAQAGLSEAALPFVRSRVGLGAASMLRVALQERGSALDPLTLLPEFLDHYRCHLGTHTRPFPTVVDTLGRLRADGVRMAVVTNKRRQFSESRLAHAGLSEFFDVITCGDTPEMMKPDPAPVLLTLERLEIAPADAVFVGDSVHDILAANAAGIAICVMKHGYHGGENLVDLRIDRCLEVMADLLD